MDLVLCKICKEPIWSFICVDCLAEDIGKVLPHHIVSGFSAFHKEFSGHFHSDYDHEPCIKCRGINNVTVCPYCYLSEVIEKLFDRDVIMTKRLIRFLPFLKHPYFKKDAVAITELHNEKSMNGPCDECGEYSEDLEESCKGWVCERCGGD